MANRLNIDLSGKVVKVDKKYFKGIEYLFLCHGGFGCFPDTMGSAVCGQYLIDAEDARIEGYMIKELVNDPVLTCDNFLLGLNIINPL